MTVTKYEIDMLNVKAADACLIHFFDEEDNDYLVLVDAGNYGDGQTIVEFIKNRYGRSSIDLAICTHCDSDHFGGFIYLLEQIRDNTQNKIDIKEIWVHDPADHIDLGQIKWVRKEETKDVKARSVYDLGDKNLLDILDGLTKSIRWYEPFSDGASYPGKPYKAKAFDGKIEVVGPSVKFYESLVVDFRNDLSRKDYNTKDDEDDTAELRSDGTVYSKTLDEAGDDPSTQNQSSVLFVFKPDDNKKFFFMGDAGRKAIDNIKYEQDINLINEVEWLKVPHHGSKYNLDNVMLNHIHPKVAYISTEKIGHYLSMAVVNGLKKCGCSVYSTHKASSIWYHKNTDSRADYSSATPL